MFYSSLNNEFNERNRLQSSEKLNEWIFQFQKKIIQVGRLENLLFPCIWEENQNTYSELLLVTEVIMIILSFALNLKQNI